MIKHPFTGQRFTRLHTIKLAVAASGAVVLAVATLVPSAFAQNTNTPQSSSSFWLRPFQWSNQDQPVNEQPAPKFEQNGSSSAVANRSSQPPTNPIQKTSGRQSSNPLAWTNNLPTEASTASANSNLNAGNVRTFDQPSSKSQLDATNPLAWSNETKPTTNAASLKPPEQTSFSESVLQTLSWKEPDATSDPLLENSKPPVDATEEQLVEWEKENLPWIRPFYWSEPEFGTPEALALQPNPGLSPSQTEGSQMSMLAKPFLWTNQPTTAAVQPSDLRTIAFLQNGEELPEPPQQPGVPGLSETLPPAKDSAENPLSISEDGEEDKDKGAIGQAETLGREPVDNSLQFLRASTVLLKPGESQWDYGFTYTLFDQTLPVFVTSPASTTIELARFRRREMILPLELRYGLARRIQLFLNAPFGWSNTEFALASTDTFENTGGLGDIIFGGTFLLRQGDHETSDAIMTLATTAPTGQDPFAPVVGLTPSAPALGGGTWSIASNLLFVRNYDPVVVFYGVGTRQHLLRKINGLAFRAGGEYNYQFGVGFAVNEKVTFSTRFNGAYVSESRVDGTRILGSIQEPMTVGLAMTVSKCKRLIEPFIDFGITNDSTDARFGITWTR